MVEFKGRSKSIFIVTIVFLCISLIAVCLRCFVRLKLVKGFGWDDGLMVSAMVYSYSEFSHRHDAYYYSNTGN